jgi:hypothetical protein
LPDIAFPPPAEGDIEEDILEQILPEDDCSLSGSQVCENSAKQIKKGVHRKEIKVSDQYYGY